MHRIVVACLATATAVSSFAETPSVELTSPYDVLTVYDGTTILWRGTRPPGSPSSFLSMFSDFRADVEKTAKKP